MLKAVIGTFEKITKDEEEHARLLRELAKETGQKQTS